MARADSPESEALPSARGTVLRGLADATALMVTSALLTLLSLNALSRAGDVTEGSGRMLIVALLNLGVVLALYRGFFVDILALDPARASATPEAAEIERGFARVVNAPRFWALRAFAWFVVGGLELSILRHFLEPEAFPWTQVAIRMVGLVAGAFVYSVLLFFLLKHRFKALRESLMAGLPDREAARCLIQPVSLRAKLLIGVTGTLAVTMLYGVTLSQVRASRTAEAGAVRLAARALAALEAGGRGEMAAARRLELVDHLVRVDPLEDPQLTAVSDRLASFEIAYLLAEGLDSGDSLALDSPHYFAWRSLPDGRLAISIVAGERFAAHVPSLSGITGAFLLLVLLATIAIAWLLASDTEDALHVLSEEVARLASGDLGRGRPLAREDELGVLSAGLEHMAESLGAMIVGVRGTADRVDAAAGEIAAASADLLSTSEEQEAGAQALRASLLSVTGQVSGISSTARELTTSVDDGSRSILELRGSGQHLDETANLLSEKVEEVSSAIAELIRSVRDVLENAEHLSGAAVDTSSSMEEMAASLREVDANATETARLSQDMVGRAEDGREKVRETLKGMESIRETTETARSVIHDLGGRTKEIGAIVNVIDDVAEETNLLALNAAIIAAQAGENGRSFSVVAEEIKKLADRVLSSTKEIEGVIRSVQNETSNAVGAIEQGSRVVETGVRQAADAGAALDAITESAHASGARIGEIVTAVNEQTRAAGHVVALMERVRGGVDQIRRAGQEQDRGNEAILATSEVMREIALRVRSVTGEQAEGAGRIAEGVDAVREAVQMISAALAEQSVGCGAAEREVNELDDRTRAHGELAHALESSVKAMRADAERLREAVGRFRV